LGLIIQRLNADWVDKNKRKNLKISGLAPSDGPPSHRAKWDH